MYFEVGRKMNVKGGMDFDRKECTAYRYILLFRRVFVQHRGVEQTKTLVKAKGHQCYLLHGAESFLSS